MAEAPSSCSSVTVATPATGAAVSVCSRSLYLLRARDRRLRRAQIGVDCVAGIKVISATVHAQLPEARALLIDWRSADQVQHHPPAGEPPMVYCPGRLGESAVGLPH